MSAWLVDKVHIDLLVSAGLTLPCRSIKDNRLRWTVPARDGQPEQDWTLTRKNADEVGGKLWTDNLANIDYLYPEATDEDRPGPVTFESTHVLTYQYEDVPGTLDPVVVLNALSCFRYQSMDRPQWAGSFSAAFYEALLYACIRALPGYSDAPWGFSDRQFFVKQSR